MTRTGLAVVALVTTCVICPLHAFASTSAEACAALKVTAAGKFAECRATADSTYLMDGDAGRRDSRYARCALVLELKFTKAGLRYTVACPAPGFPDPVEGFVSACSDVTTSRLTSGAGPSVAAFCGSGTTYNAGTGTCVAPACGDGVRQISENCDGSDLGGATCVSLGFPGGSLGCTADCAFDVNGCTACVPTTTTTQFTTSTTLFSDCFSDPADGTVHDTCTGLQWEKKDTVVGSGVNAADLHDVDNVYTWAGCCNGDCSTVATYCQPNAAAAATCAAQAEGGTQGCSVCGSGTCNVDPYNYGATTTEWDWINQVNAANFAGHNDWRLPREGGCNSCWTGAPNYSCSSCNAHELETLLLAPAPCGRFPLPCINSIFGPTVADVYFSASTYSTSPSSAWYVDFSNGATANIDKNAFYIGYHVRAVRSGS